MPKCECVWMDVLMERALQSKPRMMVRGLVVMYARAHPGGGCHRPRRDALTVLREDGCAMRPGPILRVVCQRRCHTRE